MNRKKAAALIGVMMYMQQEHAEEQHLLSMNVPQNRINPWVFYGRKTTSQIRRLIQGRRIWKQYHCLPAETFTQRKIHSLQRAAYLTANKCWTSFLARKKRLKICSRNEHNKKDLE